jgi:hypothetical protein
MKSRLFCNHSAACFAAKATEQLRAQNAARLGGHPYSTAQPQRGCRADGSASAWCYGLRLSPRRAISDSGDAPPIRQCHAHGTKSFEGARPDYKCTAGHQAYADVPVHLQLANSPQALVPAHPRHILASVSSVCARGSHFSTSQTGYKQFWHEREPFYASSSYRCGQ